MMPDAQHSLHLISSSIHMKQWETSWKITNIENGILNTIAFGPPTGRNYERTTRYIGELCLSPGEYNLRNINTNIILKQYR